MDSIIMNINHAFNQEIKRAVLTCCDSATAHKRISLIALLTSADSIMVDDLTLCIGTAGSRTGVSALLIDTGQVAGTLTVDPALWSAVGRSSNVSRQT